MTVYHKNIEERWFKMTLFEQLGNVGSDVDRIISWRKKGDEEKATNAFYRAIELLDLTKKDKRWYGPKLKEICRAREILCDAFYGAKEYNTPLEYFSKYFYQYAYAARKDK